MVQIKIKGINETYHVIASFDDVEAFLILLKERLKACHHKDGSYFEAFFHINEVNDRVLMELLKLCEKCHTIVLGINYVPFHDDMEFLEGDLRGGQSYILKHPAILMGTIRKQAYVCSEESLYVIGKVLGSVDLVFDNAELCTSYLDANVRICDTPFQNMTSFSPCKVYYKNRHLEMKEYEEEKMWEKQ